LGDLSQVQSVRIDPTHAFENRLIAYHQDQSVVAAYKMMRTRVSQRLRSNNWSSIAVTAPRTGEGKSLTAINLALSLASQPKQSVFLVDLDLRRHAVASYLGLEQHSHLLSFLRRQERLDQALVLLEDPPLYMLLNDTSVETSSEMLSSDDAIEMVQQLKELGGIVIYDLPPLFAADDFLAFSVLVRRCFEQICRCSGRLLLRDPDIRKSLT
jgi:Mrp family chromosome partitioning ATPase